MPVKRFLRRHKPTRERHQDKRWSGGGERREERKTNQKSESRRTGDNLLSRSRKWNAELTVRKAVK